MNWLIQFRNRSSITLPILKSIRPVIKEQWSDFARLTFECAVWWRLRNFIRRPLQHIIKYELKWYQFCILSLLNNCEKLTWKSNHPKQIQRMLQINPYTNTPYFCGFYYFSSFNSCRAFHIQSYEWPPLMYVISLCRTIKIGWGVITIKTIWPTIHLKPCNSQSAIETNFVRR